MELFVVFLVVRLLKEDIRADARFLELSVVFDRRRRDVDIHAADRAVFVLDGIYRLDAFEHIFERIVHGVFSRLQREALVPHILQRDDLAADLVLRELPAMDMLVLRMVGTVDAAVHAIIRQIERCKEHDALAVKLLLDLLGEREHPLDEIGRVDGEQQRRLAVRESFAIAGTRQKCLYECAIVFIILRPSERGEDFLMVDELLGTRGLRIVRCHAYASLHPQDLSCFPPSAKALKP